MESRQARKGPCATPSSTFLRSATTFGSAGQVNTAEANRHRNAKAAMPDLPPDLPMVRHRRDLLKFAGEGSRADRKNARMTNRRTLTTPHLLPLSRQGRVET